MKFTDLTGTTYKYDNISGVIYKDYENSEFKWEKLNKIKNNQNERIHMLNKILLDNSKKIDIENLTEQYYIVNGIKQLTFKLTDQCNIRCKYCTYSEYYPYTAKYSNTFLTEEDAIRGVDIYMQIINKHNEEWTNTEIQPTFTFYGGEPLLRFDTIKSIVKYIHKRYSNYKPKYLMTTNALLINDEVAKFIKEHNFHISISLDGYMDNHDRNRVNIDGNGTYAIIDTIIRKYFLDYNNWNIFMCYDYKTDLDKLTDPTKFGLGEDYFFDHLGKISLVSDVNTNYYEQFSKIDYEKYVIKIQQLKDSFVNKMMNGEKLNILEKMFFEYEFIMIDDRSRMTSNNSFYDVPLGNCIPGDKLFLQTDGTFTLCEKVPNFDEYIIGDVNKGIDINKVRNLIKKVNEDLLCKCKKCDISRLCSVCYSMLYKNSDGKFSVDEKICRNQREAWKKKLGIYVSLKKKNKKLFNYYYADKYLNN